MIKQKRASKKLRKWTIGLIAVTMLIGQSVASAAGFVSTTYGRSNSFDGSATLANFYSPNATIYDPNTGMKYIADTGNNKIRMYDQGNSDVSTYAGTGVAGNQNGDRHSATFDAPSGLALDPNNNVLYVSELNNNDIRAISLDTGDVSTIVGQGTALDSFGNSATLNHPTNLYFHESTGRLYIADSYSHQIKVYDPATNLADVFAGSGAQGNLDGTLALAQFNFPSDITYIQNEAAFFVADKGNHKIRKIDVSTGMVSTFAGSGIADFSTNVVPGQLTRIDFNQPSSVTTDPSGNLIIADTGNHVVREIDLASGTIHTVAGTDMVNGVQWDVPQVGKLDSPTGVRYDASLGRVVVTNKGSNTIASFDSMIAYNSNYINFSPILHEAGNWVRSGLQDGAFQNAMFNAPRQMTSDPTGTVYVADLANHAIRKIDTNGLVTTIAGNGSSGSADGIGSTATFNYPQGIVYDDYTHHLFVADSGNHSIRMIDLTTLEVSTVAGNGVDATVDGPGATASFGNPFNLVSDDQGSIYIIDHNNPVIRKMSVKSGDSYLVSTFAGDGTYLYQDGPIASATFADITSMTIDANRKNIYVYDAGKSGIRKINLDSTLDVVTIAGGLENNGHLDGNGDVATFENIFAMHIGSDNILYMTDTAPSVIRSMDLNPNSADEYLYPVETLSGAIQSGYLDGASIIAQFSPRLGGLVQLTSGNLLIADTNNNTLRTYDFAPVITGVVDGGVYSELSNVTPKFSEGTGQISMNGGLDVSFDSGTVLNTPGNYDLRVTDSATNVTRVTFTIVGASSMPGVTSPSNVNTHTPSIYGFADPGDVIHVEITDSNTNQVVATGTGTADTTGYWIYTVDSGTPLPDGAYSVRAYAVDIYGTISSDYVGNLTVDSNPPIAPTIDHVGAQNSTNPYIDGSNAENNLWLNYTFNGVTSRMYLNVVDTFHIQFIGVPDGTYPVTIWTEDAAGNTSPVVNTTVMVDTHYPTISLNPGVLLQNTNQPVLSGVTEPFANVVVTIDHYEYLVFQADASGNWTFQDTNGTLAEGSHLLELSAEDQVGWVSGVQTYNLVIDTIAPALPVMTSPALQATSTPTLSFTSEPNATLHIDVNGTPYTVTTDANGDWTYTIPAGSPFVDGVFTLSVYAIDTAGNQGPMLNTTLEIDTNPPGAPGVSSSLIQNQTLPTFTGFADPGSVLTLIVDGKSYSTTVAGSGAWSIALPAGDELGEGSYAIHITANDLAGNVSPAYNGTLVVDMSPPTQPTVTSGSTFTTSTPSFTGTGEPGTTVRVTVNGISYNALVMIDGTWSLVLPAMDALADGTYLVKVASTDAAGNGSPVTTFNLTIDTTAPSVATVTSASGQATSIPTISGTAEQNSTVTITVDGNTYSTTTDAAGNWTYTLPNAAALQDGTYPVTVTVSDSVGLQSAPLTVQMLIDTQAPGLPTVSSAAVQTTNTPTLSGTAEANATVLLTIDGNSYSVTADANGNWSYLVPVGSALRDGTYSVTVTAVDALRNQGATLTTFIVIDATAPQSPSVTSNREQVTLTPTVTGNADPGSTLYVTLGGQTQSVVADANGDWSVTVSTPLLAGSYRVDVYAMDAAGNQSAVVSQSLDVRTAYTTASLGGLTISDGKLSPAFDRNVFSYKAGVKNAVKWLVIKPGTLPTGAVVRINGVVVPAGESLSVALKSGISNKIGIEVTAEDGVTKVMYTLHVYRTAIKAYTQGYAGKNFRPDALIKREEMAYMLDQLFTKGKGSKGTGNYSDIGQMYWAKKEIVSVARKGVMLGFNNTKFGFGQKLTRQQFATIIDRIVGLKKNPKRIFKDTVGMQDSKVMASAVEAGYMKSYKDGTFRPNEGVTRAEVIILLNKLSNRDALTDRYAPQWNDVSTSHYAYAEIQNASIGR